MEVSLGRVKIKKIEAMLRKIKRDYEGSPIKPEEIELTAEFIIPSLFPQIYKNFEEKMKLEHTKGYLEGLNASKCND